MTENSSGGVDPRLRNVFANVLSAETAQALRPSSSNEDVPGWDSQTFVAVVIGIEQEFAVRFSTLEAARMGSVDSIQQLLREKGVALDT